MSKKSISKREKRRKRMFKELRDLDIVRQAGYCPDRRVYINKLFTSTFGKCFAQLEMNANRHWSVALPCGQILIQTPHLKDAVGIIRTLKLVAP